MNKIYNDSRDATFEELYEIAVRDKNVILLSCDTGAYKFGDFKKNIPDQFHNVGVSEQNAISAAAGLALTGKKVFVFGITNFVTLRCYEQIKIDICCMELPVTILGTGTGYTYSSDGPTHHITEDIPVMRALPGITIWSPSDYTMTAASVHLAYNTPGPCYIRSDKGPFTPIYDNKNIDFSEGIANLKKGKDIIIIATGVMVNQAFKAAEELKEKGIDAGIVDLYRLKPVNKKMLLNILKDSKKVITLEENTIYGGLGSIVSEIAAENGLDVRVKIMGIDYNSKYEIGSREMMRSLDELDVEGIIRNILNWTHNGI
ncbi:transketolase family protein [candidate division KSB1 bacterium]